MTPGLWLRFAARDLRSGLQGFWIFLTCLTLGTAAIAIIGSLSAAVQRGLDEQGQPLLGGDLEFSLIHRQASAEEQAFMNSQGTVSLVATLRAMAKTADATALVEVKSVDSQYPLFGQVKLEGGGAVDTALERKDGRYGVAVDPLLLGRLGIAAGDRISIGTADFDIRAIIASEPDRLSDGIVLGPRVLMRPEALAATGLVQPGSLVTWRYRLKLAGGDDLAHVKTVTRAADQKFPDAGWRVKNRSNAAQGAERFVDRLGLFMTLVGLAALIVGGAGIGNAVAAFVNRRTSSIATLKCLGASSRDIFGIYMTEIVAVALIGIALGLAAGAAAPALAQAMLASLLPLPIAASLEVKPLLVAGSLGVLVTFAFALWPVARTRFVPASALFRHRIAPAGGWPGMDALLLIGLALAAIAAIVFSAYDDRRIIGWFLGGLAASFAVLLGLARLIVIVAARLPRPSRMIARYALSNIHRPGSHAASVILALGLGLTLFVTLALTDQTMTRELKSSIPEKAPAFFFLDVRNEDLASFVAALKKEPGVGNVGSAPMMRGRMVSIKGIPVARAASAPETRWATQGDRGLTYAETLPAGSTLVEGEWWPAGYAGPPLVSMVDEIAKGLDLRIGDEITVNVLGRDITAKVANFRQVNWRSLGINFVMVFSPNTLKAAPHSHIVTVEMTGGNEAALLNGMTRQFPSVTAIRVKDAITIVSDLLGKMLNGIRGASVLTLLTGILVLAGALAAGLSERIYDAVVLKTYGATRRQLIGAFIIEYAGLGLAAAGFGILVGALASWFLAHFILELPWQFSAVTAGLTALAAMLLTVAAGLSVTWAALSARPAPLLRNE
jgi:putative ABC transport system permease protein